MVMWLDGLLKSLSLRPQVDIYTNDFKSFIPDYIAWWNANLCFIIKIKMAGDPYGKGIKVELHFEEYTKDNSLWTTAMHHGIKTQTISAIFPQKKIKRIKLNMQH